MTQTESAEKKDSIWAFLRGDIEAPRGGSTQGPKIEYDMTIPASWEKLQEDELTMYERDRRAIYSMEGTYETRFEFIETILLDTPNLTKDVPYASWATELVKVIEDRGDFYLPPTHHSSLLC